MLKIAVDATCIRNQLSGVGYYTLNLLKALTVLQESENFQLSVYFQPSVKNWLRGNWQRDGNLNGFEPVYCIPIPVSVTSLLFGWGQGLLAAWEPNLNHPDLVQGSDHFIYPCRYSCNLLTIHDLNFLKYPQWVPRQVKNYQARLEKCLPWADGILTFAESTKSDLITLWGVSPDKIYVTPQASRYQGNSLTDIQIASLQQDIPYNFAHPYFLFVGTLEPRKNVIGLIAAFNRFKKYSDSNHHLVLIGQLGWQYQPILKAIADSPYHQHIHHLNYLPESWLEVFYRRAIAFVYPSFYEGFGLPVLEAMNFACPVITSARASLPEVTGDSALLIDPQDLDTLTAAMFLLAQDEGLRQNWAAKALQRSRDFSWAQTGRKTLEVYRRLLEKKLH